MSYVCASEAAGPARRRACLLESLICTKKVMGEHVMGVGKREGGPAGVGRGSARGGGQHSRRCPQHGYSDALPPYIAWSAVSGLVVWRGVVSLKHSSCSRAHQDLKTTAELALSSRGVFVVVVALFPGLVCWLLPRVVGTAALACKVAWPLQILD